jgi:Rrf2 family cysteine metabolism transcriptional repressor
MKLLTKGRYGTRVLLHLTVRCGEGPIPLKDIAQRQRIPLPYLEHLITPLKVAGIIKSCRRPRGGIRLVKPPQEVRLNEVIPFLEGSIAPVECVNNAKTCPHSDLCVSRVIWGGMKKAMNGVLESTSLQDLVEPERRMGNVN